MYPNIPIEFKRLHKLSQFQRDIFVHVAYGLNSAKRTLFHVTSPMSIKGCTSRQKIYAVILFQLVKAVGLASDFVTRREAEAKA